MRVRLTHARDFLLIPSDDCGQVWQEREQAPLVAPYETVQNQNSSTHGCRRDFNVCLLSFGVSSFLDGE